MSCLQGCDNCDCKETNVCNSTAKMEEELNAKLKVLKDFVCVIRTTSCVNLAKIMSEYAYFLWCFLKDLVNYLINLDKRVTNLCSSIKCVNEKANSIIRYLRKAAFDNIKVTTKVSTGGGASGVTMMEATRDAAGNFRFHFTTNNYNGFKYGDGYIEGKINSHYSVNDDGSINAVIDNVFFDNIYWNMVSPNDQPNKNLSLVIKTLTGETVINKAYDARSSWRVDINKTVAFNKTYKLNPHSSSGDIHLFDIADNWIINTNGHAYIRFDNNNDSFGLRESDCGIDCDKC